MMKVYLSRNLMVFVSLAALSWSTTRAFAFRTSTTTHFRTPITAKPTTFENPPQWMQPDSSSRFVITRKRPQYNVLCSAAFSDGDVSSDEEPSDSSSSLSTTKLTFRERLAKVFPQNNGEKLPLKQQLAKMGLACVLSYGFVSNLNSVLTTAIAWFIFSKKTALSPLAPGQWKPFLAIYGGLWVFNNFVRPIRVALAVGISPLFDRAVLGIQTRLNVSKGVAIGLTMFVANFLVTLGGMVLGIAAASALAGVPVFPPRV